MNQKEKRAEKLPPLEAGLLSAMRALDNQIQREMQRTPAERAEQGVLKWEPYQKRVERVAAFVLDSLGGKELELDSLIVLAQALTKALKLTVEDLGESGLGKIRTSYCLDAMTQIGKDAEDSQRLLGHVGELV